MVKTRNFIIHIHRQFLHISCLFFIHTNVFICIIFSSPTSYFLFLSNTPYPVKTVVLRIPLYAKIERSKYMKPHNIRMYYLKKTFNGLIEIGFLQALVIFWHGKVVNK